MLLYDHALPIEQSYINLTIIETKKIDKKPVENHNNENSQHQNNPDKKVIEIDKEKLTYLSSFEEIYAEHKDSISLGDIFKPKDGKTPQHILIERQFGV